jgi:hypothetical protein
MDSRVRGNDAAFAERGYPEREQSSTAALSRFFRDKRVAGCYVWGFAAIIQADVRDFHI